MRAQLLEERAELLRLHGVVDVVDDGRLAHRQVGPGQDEADAAAHPVAVAHDEVGHVGGEPGGVEGKVGPVVGEVVEAHGPSLPRIAGRGRGVFHRVRRRSAGVDRDDRRVTRMPWHGIRDLALAPMSVDDAHTRPAGTTDATVEAVGKLSEAFEVIEDARGQLFGFHRKIGMADLALGEAVELLRDAGHDDLADRIETDLVGRNILAGRWTFQIVEEFEDGYYAAFRDHERVVREELMGGQAARLRGGDEAGPAHAGAARATRRRRRTARSS